VTKSKYGVRQVIGRNVTVRAEGTQKELPCYRLLLPVMTVERSVLFGCAWAVDSILAQIRINAGAPPNDTCSTIL
jgi:hypothetical protein